MPEAGKGLQSIPSVINYNSPLNDETFKSFDEPPPILHPPPKFEPPRKVFEMFKNATYFGECNSVYQIDYEYLCKSFNLSQRLIILCL